MAVRKWDFRCDDCGKEHPNTLISEPKIPQTIPCECGGTASWASFAQNYIHETHSWRYGKYDEALDCVVESRAHLKVLLKEKGLQDASDPIGGNRKHSEEVMSKYRPRRESPIEWSSLS